MKLALIDFSFDELQNTVEACGCKTPGSQVINCSSYVSYICANGYATIVWEQMMTWFSGHKLLECSVACRQNSVGVCFVSTIFCSHIIKMSVV